MVLVMKIQVYAAHVQDLLEGEGEPDEHTKDGPKEWRRKHHVTHVVGDSIHPPANGRPLSVMLLIAAEPVCAWCEHQYLADACSLGRL